MNLRFAVRLMQWQLCSCEGYLVRAQFPVHRVNSLWRRVDEVTVFEAQQARLTRAGPKFIPTSIESVNDSVSFDNIRPNVSEHRVKQGGFLLVGRWIFPSPTRPACAST